MVNVHQNNEEWGHFAGPIALLFEIAMRLEVRFGFRERARVKLRARLRGKELWL